MNARAFSALTLNGFREARRNRVTVVIGIFAVLLIAASSLVTNVTLGTFDRVLTDVGLGLMSLMMVLLTVFLSSGLLSREIERRTLFLIVSKPVSRTGFLLARFAGNMVTVSVVQAAMLALFLGEVVAFGTAITQAQIVAGTMLWFELLVLSSVGFAMSSFSGPIVSSSVTVGVYFAGHLSGDIYQLVERSTSAFIRGFGKFVYYALPNLERVNFRSEATYALEVPAGTLLSSAAYASAYAVVMLAIAVLAFRRRDFR